MHPYVATLVPQYTPERIIGIRLRKRRTEYLVVFNRGSVAEASWEDAWELDCPDLIREFNQTDMLGHAEYHPQPVPEIIMRPPSPRLTPPPTPPREPTRSLAPTPPPAHSVNFSWPSFKKHFTQTRDDLVKAIRLRPSDAYYGEVREIQALNRKHQFLQDLVLSVDDPIGYHQFEIILFQFYGSNTEYTSHRSLYAIGVFKIMMYFASQGPYFTLQREDISVLHFQSGHV